MPSPEVVVFEPSSPVVVEVVVLVPTFKLLHWKGAGPPSSVRVAAVGVLVSRYCWAALTVPVAEYVEGAIVATTTPTPVSCCLMTLGVTVPLTGA